MNIYKELKPNTLGIIIEHKYLINDKDIFTQLNHLANNLILPGLNSLSDDFNFFVTKKAEENFFVASLNSEKLSIYAKQLLMLLKPLSSKQPEAYQQEQDQKNEIHLITIMLKNNSIKINEVLATQRQIEFTHL